MKLLCRLAAAAPIGPLAWELSHAEGAGEKKKRKEKKKCSQTMIPLWILRYFPIWGMLKYEKNMHLIYLRNMVCWLVK